MEFLILVEHRFQFLDFILSFFFSIFHWDNKKNKKNLISGLVRLHQCKNEFFVALSPNDAPVVLVMQSGSHTRILINSRCKEACFSTWNALVNRGFSCDMISSKFCKSCSRLPYWFPLRMGQHWEKQQNVALLFINFIPHYQITSMWQEYQHTLGWNFKSFHELYLKF